jgi:carboxyl-terminal processing protease
MPRQQPKRRQLWQAKAKRKTRYWCVKTLISGQELASQKCLQGVYFCYSKRFYGEAHRSGQVRTVMNTKLKVAGWISMGALAGALTTISVQSVAQRALAPLPLEELQQLAAVFGMIKTDYVEPVDEKKLITEAISGMVTSLDPHSQYFDKKSFKEFREGTSGRFVGVGIEIAQEDGLIKVVSPIEGSPAFRAGLKPNDLITKIDDTAVKGLALNEAVKRMRGEPNTKVILTLLRREENNRTFSVTITREEIRTQSVRSKNIESGYAWLRVSQFQERTTEDFSRKLEEIYRNDNNLKGLVLDLRNDPGGLLDAAVAISAAFLPDNVTVVSTNGQLAESKFTYKASPEFYRRGGNDPIKRLNDATKNIYKTLPVVVLVNEGSASASEIVAGALQDHGRAKIMGSQTFGKGSVQVIRPLGPDTGLKLTTSRYYTPKGNSIQAKGIIPDIMLDETAEGNLFAALRTREADLTKHLEDKNDPAAAEKAKAAEKEREKEREEARKRLEEFNKKPESERRQPEFGSDKDFQLQQAINQLKGRDVMVSKTLTARKDAPKEQ